MSCESMDLCKITKLCDKNIKIKCLDEDLKPFPLENCKHLGGFSFEEHMKKNLSLDFNCGDCDRCMTCNSEYDPVCHKETSKTFSNKCVAETSGYTDIVAGKCS